MAELGYEPEPFYISSDRTILASSKGQTGTITYGFNAEEEGASVIATSDSEWITVEIPEVAEGEEPTNSVSYHIAPATTTEPRTGNITLTYSDFSQTVVVEQDGGTHSFVVYANSDVLYNYEAHEVTIGYDLELPEAGVEVTATLSEQVDWITDITNTYDATKSTSGNIAFNVAEHTTKGDRQVTLTIAYGDKKYDILILQEDNFPDDVVMDVVSVSASMRTGGKVWDLTLNEQTENLGEVPTQITVGMRTANTQYLVSDTYKTPISRGKGVYAGSVDAQGAWSNSVYRYSTSRKEAITDCELTIAIDEATQTAAISGHFVSQQTDDETGRTFDVNVIFEWDGPVPGFLWENPTDEITNWNTFAIDSSFDDCKVIRGESAGGSTVAIFLHTLGATKDDPLAAGTYTVADWAPTTTSNYCESGSTKVNGHAITSGSVTVEGSGDNYTVRYELSDGSSTYKGVYTGALQ
ncbi:MAG: BACON domain-containing protein [Alistipes sp.]|nr:BACON domain-containing protein [Alistipes sp.]